MLTSCVGALIFLLYMIDYVRGHLAELNPAYAVVDCNGVGYMLNISIYSYDKLHSLSDDEETKLFVYESIREDAHVLFGFYSKLEREIFELLITVSGIGPNTARVILSSLPPDELRVAIATEDVNSIKAVKGIGAKTAQRIIVDLKDKISATGATLSSGSALQPISNVNATLEESLSALVMLGFNQQTALKTIKAILKEDPNTTVENTIKKALKMM